MFKGILGRYGRMLDTADGGLPDFFHDLKLDSVISPILASDPSGTLRRIYLSPPGDESVIRGREDVFRDLADRELRDFLDSFSLRFRGLGEEADAVSSALGDDGRPSAERRLSSRFLHLAEEYVRGVEELRDALDAASVSSSGLVEFSSYLHDYISSEGFGELARDSRYLRERFSRLRYTLSISRGTFRVFPCAGEESLAERVRLLFGDLAEEGGGSSAGETGGAPLSENVEESVMGLLERTFPEEFSVLRSFCRRHPVFMDPVIMDFSREIRFYISWLGVVGRLEGCGLHFCLPEFASSGFHADDFFDMALASEKGAGTVTSSFRLDGRERILVVTGPNQGGKTTYARAFGSLHYLASLGLPVPGTCARLMLADAVFTHFGREEDIMGGKGLLEDDVSRLRSILEGCTARSVIVINEIFSSTTAADAAVLGGRMLDMIAAKGAAAAVVTFLDELAHHGPEVVSMVSLTRPDDPGARTYHLERGEPDGRAHAMALAERYGLDPVSLAGRLEAWSRV